MFERMTAINARLSESKIRALLALALAAGGSAATAAETLHFEDVFEECPDYGMVFGPCPVTIEGVTFSHADETLTYNVGRDFSIPVGLGNPFDSDSLHFWTYDDGATIEFPAPITELSFHAGTFTNVAFDPTFDLIAGGEVLATFEANRFEITPVSVAFDEPVEQVLIRFVDGTDSLLGIDDLTYEPIEQPCPEDVNGDDLVDVLDLLAVLAAWGEVHTYPGGTLHFEDLFGECTDQGIVNGPCPVTIEDVTFSHPDYTGTKNVGKDHYDGTPFSSDSFHFWTYKGGATVAFPAPVTSLSFDTGVFTPMFEYPTFDLIADGSVVATFQAFKYSPASVAVGFDEPVESVTIKFVKGSAGLLGIDNLAYETVDQTEPADINGDGMVDVLDLLAILAAWGACP